MVKPLVILDMDDTIYEFVIPILDRYNLRYDDMVGYGDITDWEIHKFLKPECKDVFKEFCTEGFFAELYIHTDVIKWLKVLNEIATVRFVTAGCSQTTPYRSELLARELDFFEDSMLVKLTDKNYIAETCNYFVDDNEKLCDAVRKTNPNAVVYQISRPWNGEIGCNILEALYNIVMDILRG